MCSTVPLPMNFQSTEFNSTYDAGDDVIDLPSDAVHPYLSDDEDATPAATDCSEMPQCLFEPTSENRTNASAMNNPVVFGKQMVFKREKNGWSAQENNILRACLSGVVPEYNKLYYQDPKQDLNGIEEGRVKIRWKPVCDLLSAVNPSITRTAQPARCAWGRLRQEDAKVGFKLDYETCKQVVKAAESRLISLQANAAANTLATISTPLPSKATTRPMDAPMSPEGSIMTQVTSPPSRKHSAKATSRVICSSPRATIQKHRNSRIMINPSAHDLFSMALGGSSIPGRCTYCGEDSKNNKPHKECLEKLG